MIVIFKPQNCVPQRKAGIFLDKIHLKPGMNTLSEAESETLIAHPSYSRYESLGAIVLKEDTEKVDPVPLTEVPQNLSGYNVSDSEEIIDETHDIDVLKRWLSAETRVTARRALEQRIGDLTGA